MEQGHKGPYIGIDISIELLNIAQEHNKHPEAHFILKDIAESEWSRGLPNSFDRVFSFATLHHLPGEALRESVLATLSGMLKTSGLLVFSVWNFLASDRLRARIVPWERVNIDPQELDPEDHLLDWRRGGYGLRYVHAFSQAELERIAQKTGYRVMDTYFSDGEGGKLGWYHVWQPHSKVDL
jgi:hypothetical protein